MDTTELDQGMRATVEAGDASSISWLLARGDDVHVGTAGDLDADPGRPTARDTIFRISSMTKPAPPSPRSSSSTMG